MNNHKRTIIIDHIQKDQLIYIHIYIVIGVK